MLSLTTARRCVLCGRSDTRLITSAGWLGLPVDALICRDWTECSDRR